MLLTKECSCFKRLRQTASAANSTSAVPLRNTEGRMVSMFKKLRVSIRIQFLVIALSLAVMTTILSLSSYLKDKEAYDGTFRTAADSELGFKITGEKYQMGPQFLCSPGLLYPQTRRVARTIPSPSPDMRSRRPTSMLTLLPPNKSLV